MREAFEQEAEKTGKSRLMITMAVPASLEYAAKGFDIASLDKSLDFFNLLTYDYHSSYEPATNHHSPLFRPADVSEFDFRADLNIVSYSRPNKSLERPSFCSIFFVRLLDFLINLIESKIG